MKATVLSLLATIFLFRLTALIIGCFYGPYIYAVVTLGGLYLVMDVITAYFIYASDDETSISSSERNFTVSWIFMNALGCIGLIVADVFFLVDLGFWSMTYTPIHLVQFVIITCLVVLVIMAILLLVMGINRKRKTTGSSASYQGLAASTY